MVTDKFYASSATIHQIIAGPHIQITTSWPKGIKTTEIYLSNEFTDRIDRLEKKLRRHTILFTALFCGNVFAALQATAHVFGWW